jgi:hypothetical protein
VSYAVVLCDRRDDIAGALMLVDDRLEAEALAIELRKVGQRVEVKHVGDALARRDLATAATTSGEAGPRDEPAW